MQALPYGVPQGLGSVLSPFLYSVYTPPPPPFPSLGDIARSHDLSYHFYAEDTQLHYFIFWNVIA